MNYTGNLCHHSGEIRGVCGTGDKVLTVGEDGKLNLWNAVAEDRVVENQDSIITFMMKQGKEEMITTSKNGSIDVWFTGNDGGYVKKYHYQVTTYKSSNTNISFKNQIYNPISSVRNF